MRRGQAALTWLACEPSNQVLGELLRRDFTKPIHALARRDLDRLGIDAPLDRLLAHAVERDIQVTPICDAEGRLKGLVGADDLLRGLQQAMVLADIQGSEEGAPAHG